MPRFSLVIPTLQRADTFRHALATLADQSYEDFEIVVQNNGGDPETETVVRERNDPRIRHCSTESIITMTENWEAALSNTRGEFIVFIGDDDGLFPDACRIAAVILDRTDAEILNWLPFCYYWPNYLHPELRNRLVAVVAYDFHAQILSSEDQLQRFYRFAIDYSQLPMIYNSFVRRSVIERAIAATGRYFMGLAPDVASGIVNAAFVSQFVRLSRPLSITGLSHHSIHNALVSGRGTVPAVRMKRDFGTAPVDDRLVPLESQRIQIANDMLFARDRIPTIRNRTEFSFRGLVETIAAAVNERPGHYQETLEAVRTLAARHGVDLTDVVIQAPLEKRPALKCGVTALGHNRKQFVIDGHQNGLSNIADAIKFMGQLVARTEEIEGIEIKEIGTDDRVVRRGNTITFGLGGNGLPNLFAGWGEPEEWGTWSIAKRAILRLSIDPNNREPLQTILTYRSFLYKRHRQVGIVCRVQGRDIAAWKSDVAASSGTQLLMIPGDLIGADGIIDLEFLVSDPSSPAELGLSADRRLLGLGIEALNVAA